ncbi:hypothetical protein PPSAL_0210 [Ectopseudomonas oleovorans]|uniref:TIGR02444 family protein n=1 Tax=Ectopseudomonas oleovorans (strain CECT 5344) TaxID=1182590 RepID=W6QQP1_ECTO5|nr:hypothetical protein BN5_0213 [Pseudomonas oleovorans CECT 5344]CDR89448.1 hypothetical protein PPSAL_0210 [Pseudomonas oleovorans]
MQDLWNFALELYARAGVEQACLELQDTGSDVCLLLTGAWLQRRGVRCLAACRTFPLAGRIAHRSWNLTV